MASPKLNSWFEANPRGNLWRNDHNRFGFKMLSKMGWQKDKGLGKNEDGLLELKTGPQNHNNSGIGWKQSLVAIDTQDYDNVLAKLNKVFAKSESFNKAEDSGSIEKRSQQFKNRLHYQKFVKGKDVGRYSKKDMEGIFISKKKETTTPTIESGQNMLDYFASKMKMKSGAPVTHRQNTSESFEGERHSDAIENNSCISSQEAAKAQDIPSKSKKRKRTVVSDSTNDTNLTQAIGYEQIGSNPDITRIDDDGSSSPLNAIELDANRRRKKRKVSESVNATVDPSVAIGSEEIASNSERVVADDSVETTLNDINEQYPSQKSKKRKKSENSRNADEKYWAQTNEVEQTSKVSSSNSDNSSMLMSDDSIVQGRRDKSKKRKKYQKAETCSTSFDESRQTDSTSTPKNVNQNDSSNSILGIIKSCLKSGIKNTVDAKRRVSFKRKLYRRDIDEDSNVIDSKQKLRDPDPTKMPYWKVGFLRKYAQFTSEDADSIVTKLFADDAKEAIAQIKALQESAELQASRAENSSQDETDVEKQSDSVVPLSKDKERTSAILSNVMCNTPKTQNECFTNLEIKAKVNKQSEDMSTGVDNKKQASDIFVHITYGSNKKQSGDLLTNIDSKIQSENIPSSLTHVDDTKEKVEISTNLTSDSINPSANTSTSTCCKNEWELLKISNNSNGAWQESQRIAMRMDKYRDMKYKLKKHLVLKKTNMCCIKGYGNWGL